MINLKDKTAIVYDNGLFTELAEKLAEDFGKVYLYVPWKCAYPKFNHAYIGTGLKNVIRIQNFWDHVPEADVVVFPDIYDGDLQNQLKDMGKLVFGSGKGEEIELYRWSAKEKFKELGIDVIPAIRVKGISELRRVLKDTANKFVKISCYRAMMETFCNKKYFLSEPLLDQLEKDLGPFKEEFYFVVEDCVEAIEMGAENFVADGKYTNTLCAGYEIKDKSYIGTFYSGDSLPLPLKTVNDKLLPYLKEIGMRGMFSTEVRINSQANYLTDPCMRAGVPPGEVMFETISNWGEIIWEIANGRLPEVKRKGKYMVEVMLSSEFAINNWMPIYIPDEIKPFVKVQYPVKFDDYWYVTPMGYNISKIGAVIAYDDDLNAAIEKVKTYADKVEGFNIGYDATSLDEAASVIKAGENYGIKF